MFNSNADCTRAQIVMADNDVFTITFVVDNKTVPYPDSESD